MIKSILTNLFICITLISFSQQYQYKFAGILDIDGENSDPTFIVEFNVINNQIDGISYFRTPTQEETKGKLVGHYDGEYIFFYEAEILPPFKENFNYCLINMVKKVPLKDLNSSFSAEFVGYLNGRSTQICGKGKIIMTVEPPDIPSTPAIDTVPAQQPIIDTPQMLKEPDALPQVILVDTSHTTARVKQEKTIKHQNEYIFYTSDETVNIHFYDPLSDQDRIDVFVDGVLVLDNMLINHEITSINVPIVNNSVEVKVVSTSNGKEPPNTTIIDLYDEKNELQLNLQIELNQYVIIHLKRK